MENYSRYDPRTLDRVAKAAIELQKAVDACGFVVNVTIGGAVKLETDGILVYDPVHKLTDSEYIKESGELRVAESADGGKFTFFVPRQRE